MCYIAGILTLALFFAPPLYLARLWWPADALWRPLGVVAASWFILWMLLYAITQLLGGPKLQRWTISLLSATHPALVARLSLVSALLALALNFGGLNLINNLFETRYVLPPETTLLALFALLVEVGRMFEQAALDEYLWRNQNRVVSPSVTEG